MSRDHKRRRKKGPFANVVGGKPGEQIDRAARRRRLLSNESKLKFMRALDRCSGLLFAQPVFGDDSGPDSWNRL